MRWPHRKKSETRSESQATTAVAPVAAPAQTVPRASGRDWLSLPVLTTTIVTVPATTTDTRTFASSLAMTQPMVHAFEPRQRSSAGPSGTMIDAADVRPLATPSSPQVLHGPSDLPRLRLRKVPVSDGSPTTIVAPAVDLIPAPTRSFEPVPEPDDADDYDEPSPPSGVEVIAPAREAGRRGRPNLGQSRRLGLGAPLSPLPEDIVPQDVRDDIQAAFGVDVSDVVIRRDDEAAREAREAAATAFARGGDEVVLPPDLGTMDQPHVKGALAHELTHIAQQRLHGTSLPSESSDAGAALEAAARAAEQRFRGDANAPSLEQSMRDQAKQWLSTGVANRNAEGELVFLPRSSGPDGVQRLPAATATPDYSWQTTWLQEHHPDALPAERGLFSRYEPSAADLDRLGQQNEVRYLHDFVRFREDTRRDEVQGTGAAGQEEARRRFRQLPAAQPHPETPAEVTEQLTPAQQAALDEARALHARLTEAHEQLEHEKELVQRKNRAVEDVDNRFPLRDFMADTTAHTEPEPELPADARQSEERLTALRTEHPELVHYFPVSTNHPEPSPHPTGGAGTTPRTAGGGSALGTGGSPSGGPLGTGTAHGTGGPGGGHAVAGALTLAGDVANIAWEAGVFTTPSAVDRFAESTGGGGFGGLFSRYEPTDADRAQEEAQHLPQLRARRAARFRELAVAKANEVRREYHTHGKHVPSETEALALITAGEWQTIIDTVESELPLSMHQLTDENRLIADTVNSGDLIPLVANAPATRDPAAAPTGAGAAPTTAAGATPAADATATPTATDGTAPATTDATAAGTPATHGEHHEGHGLLAGAAAAVLGGGLGALAAGLHHETHFGDRSLGEHDIDLSPEMLLRLTAELYPMLRSRLRTEFIVDRERAGLLPDFR